MKFMFASSSILPTSHDPAFNRSCVSTVVPPPNTADLGTDEKAAVFGNRRYWESYITLKNLIWDLEMGGLYLSGGVGGGRGDSYRSGGERL